MTYCWEWEYDTDTQWQILDCFDSKYVMQYTWLKDKNWKEIYEGDIVKWWGDYDFDDWIGVVCFWKYEVDTSWYEYWTQKVYWPYIDCTEYLKKMWRYEYTARTFYNNKIEVIWNIYENKDLLDKQQNNG